uniref:NmrA-like domain-containing protein n=1 Tax=Oryza barthii TaxID=65489 RepID=A0A0D3FIH0_9ORYZ
MAALLISSHLTAASSSSTTSPTARPAPSFVSFRAANAAPKGARRGCPVLASSVEPPPAASAAQPFRSLAPSETTVLKPLLEFQRAKLRFEGELAAEASRDPSFTYSIVRPTAFFKSLGGQVETVKNGQPYVMFGDGKLCACKPISEEDLAAFIADCISDEGKANKILPIGGPGKALTPLEQGEMLFRLLGREPRFIKVPIQVMDAAIWVLDALAKVFPGVEDAAEFGKIGRYYASESMLVLDPDTGEYSDEMTPSYGSDTLEQFFERVIREGMAGQELGEQTIF